MNIFYIDIIGFAAAIITNFSFYPQAYEVYLITSTHEYEKLNSLSLGTFALTGFGCTLWLIYSSILQIYPIILGSILTIIPAIYISSTIIFWRYCYKQVDTHRTQDQDVDFEIIVTPTNTSASQLANSQL